MNQFRTFQHLSSPSPTPDQKVVVVHQHSRQTEEPAHASPLSLRALPGKLANVNTSAAQMRTPLYHTVRVAEWPIINGKGLFSAAN